MEPGSSIQRDESSDVSPKTVVPAGASKNEYFPDHNAGGSTTSAMTTDSVDLSDRKSSAASFSPRLSTVNPENSSPVSPPEEWQGNLNGLSRKSSGTSITIRLPRNPSLPQGTEKRMSRPRIRAASPQPVRSLSMILQSVCYLEWEAQLQLRHYPVRAVVALQLLVGSGWTTSRSNYTTQCATMLKPSTPALFPGSDIVNFGCAMKA
ncbi:unnamed protein product [Clonostachys rhizophaga]|uniref:Uncharacterized protein n=1 Tax=Clonostachys rhizophaga TaxID=160324 RepID=A0A9N9YHJ9_9HYPO|nr:unnamed protein product [Clonostachys rhizophaga]